MDFFKLVLFALAILFVVIQILIVKYLFDLEKIGCDCAMDWRRSYIIFFLIISIVNAFASLFIGVHNVPVIQTIFFVIAVLNVIFTLQYVARLKKEKCECSESVYREVMFIVSIVNAVVFTALITYAVYILFNIASYLQKSKSVVNKGVNKVISVRPLKQIKKVITPKK